MATSSDQPLSPNMPSPLAGRRRALTFWLQAGLSCLVATSTFAQNDDFTISGRWSNNRNTKLITFHRLQPAPNQPAAADLTAPDLSGDWHGVVEGGNWPITLHINKDQTGQYMAMVEHPSESSINGLAQSFIYNPPFVQFTLQGKPYATGHFDGQIKLTGALGQVNPSVTGSGRPNLIIADFEGPDYGNWTVTGDAFGTGPASISQFSTQPASASQRDRLLGVVGHGFVYSCPPGAGEKATGTLTSPPFVIERPYITFLIGGGYEPGHLCVNLLVNGQALFSTTSFRTGNRLKPVSWDLRTLAGRQAQIQIIDNSTRKWGYIDVDQIVQSDQSSEEVQMAAAAPTYAVAGRPSQNTQTGQNPPQPASQQPVYVTSLETEPAPYTHPAPVQNEPAPLAAPGLLNFPHVLDVQLMDKLGESKLFSVLGEKELNQVALSAPADTSVRPFLGVASVQLVSTLASRYGLPAPAAPAVDFKNPGIVTRLRQAGVNHLLATSLEDYSDQTLEMRRSKDYHYQTYQAGTAYGRSGYNVAALATQGGLDPEVWQRQIIRLTVRCQLFDVATGELKKSANKTFSIPRDFVAVAVGKNQLSTADLFEAAARQVSDWEEALVANEVFPIKILVKHNQEVTISRGAEANLKVGQVYEVKVKGDVIKDPDTGKVLGYDIQTVGRVTITQLEPQFSHAKILEDSGIVVGAMLSPVDE